MKQVKLAFLIIPMIIGVMVGLSLPLISPFELKTKDIFFKIRKEAKPNPSLITIEVDEEAINALSYPVPRNIYALLLGILKEAKVVAFDIFFDSPSAKDEDFKAALAQGENDILGIGFFIQKKKGPFPTIRPKGVEQIEKFSLKEIPPYVNPPHSVNTLLPLSSFLSQASIGHLNLFSDPDGVIRKMPLLIEYDGRVYPSLSLQIAAEIKGMTPDCLIKNLPLDKRGNILINFRKRDYQSYSLLELLKGFRNGKIGFSDFKGKAVLIGQTGPSIGDYSPTPISSFSPNLFIHREVVANLLEGDTLYSPPLWLAITIIILFSLLSGLITLFPVRINALLFLAFLAIYFILSFFLFLKGILLNVFSPVLAGFLSYSASTGYALFFEEKEKRRIRSFFKRYVSEGVVDKILSRQFEALRRKELTILFSDIKGFSNFSERAQPEEITEMLGRYFDEMTEIVFKYGGTLDKFIGDGILAFFGDPDELPNHALSAVNSALEMQRKVSELNKEWKKEGKETISIRIGINTGFVTVGAIGSKRRSEYTVLGREVNLAQRLESNAEPGKILISHRTFCLVQDRIKAKQLKEIEVKGEKRAVTVYEVDPF